MKDKINKTNFFEHYSSFKLNKIGGRYLIHKDLAPVLEEFRGSASVEIIGSSFLGVPIQSVQIGTGKIKVMAWSQMHGNEVTSTKALLDLFNLLITYSDHPQVKELLSRCTLLAIPMLNPDGAARYTRENVNQVDLNRDAHNLLEEESRVLRKCFDQFQPDFALNLHDQRTIFGAGNSSKPATLSFLAPAMDEQRNISASRKKSMQLIAAINADLQGVIPGQVGRYDDAFNINCTGDTFQSQNVPTILYEAGHYPQDYLREETRKYFCFALFSALSSISSGDYEIFDVADYNRIPENKKNFFDIILRNAVVAGEKVDVALQFEEKMKGGEIHFEPVLKTMAPSLSYFGHMEIDCEGGEIKPASGAEFSENDLVQSILLNGEKLSMKSQNIP